MPKRKRRESMKIKNKKANERAINKIPHTGLGKKKRVKKKKRNPVSRNDRIVKYRRMIKKIEGRWD